MSNLLPSHTERMMEDEVPNADKIQHRLDQGKYVVLYQNGLGTYTAVTISKRFSAEIQAIVDRHKSNGNHITDHRTVTKALDALAEKV